MWCAADAQTALSRLTFWMIIGIVKRTVCAVGNTKDIKVAMTLGVLMTIAMWSASQPYTKRRRTMRSNYWDEDTEEEVAKQEEAAEKCECYDLTTAQAEIAELQGQVELQKDTAKHYADMCIEKVEAFDELDAQVERYRAALEWYADGSNYTIKHGRFVDGKATADIDRAQTQWDRGNRARTALNPQKGSQ